MENRMISKPDRTITVRLNVTMPADVSDKDALDAIDAMIREGMMDASDRVGDGVYEEVHDWTASRLKISNAEVAKLDD
jgi:hypothetical protein